VAKTSDYGESARKQLFAAVEQGQQFTLEAVTVWTDLVTKALPAFPTLVKVDALPDVREQFDVGFDFAEKVLASQRALANKVLDVIVPTPAAA